MTKTITANKNNNHMVSREALQKLATKRIAICCLARDCAKVLPANITRLHTLASHFAETQFIVVENNSKDHTRQIIDRWKQKSKHKVLLPNIYEFKDRISDIDINFNRDVEGKSSDETYLLRIKRIALARDCYLDAVYQSNFLPDYILMFDIDIFNFSIQGILDTLASSHKFDAVTANGQIYEYDYVARGIRKKYYDSYAAEEWNTESSPFDIKLALQKKITETMKNGEWLKVHSAFGGFGIYTYQSIYTPSSSTYLAAILADEYKYCEHVSFHRALRNKGFDNIYISPQMELFYNTKLRALAKAFLKKMKLR